MRRRLVTSVGFVALAALTLAPNASVRVESAPAASSAARAGDAGDWLFVAVLRADGVVVPFATYWQGYWLTPWPALVEHPTAVNSLADLPRAWFADFEEFTRDWYAAGKGRAARLRATRAVEVGNHCQKNWGLLTDFKGVPDGEGCHGRRQIVTSEPADVVAPATLDPKSPRLGALRALVRARLDADEDAWLARPDMGLRARTYPPRAERRRRAPTVKHLSRVEAGGGRVVYFFEAERRYPKPPGAHDAGCENLSSLGGVLMQTGRGPLRRVESEFALTDCDAKEIGTARPLGLLRDGARRFIFVEEHGYEDEAYTILELLGAGTLRRLRRVEGGAC